MIYVHGLAGKNSYTKLEDVLDLKKPSDLEQEGFDELEKVVKENYNNFNQNVSIPIRWRRNEYAASSSSYSYRFETPLQTLHPLCRTLDSLHHANVRCRTRNWFLRPHTRSHPLLCSCPDALLPAYDVHCVRHELAHLQHMLDRPCYSEVWH